jgi:hypothetical protein
MTMDWKKQFKVHDLSFRDFCVVLLVIAVNLLILIFSLDTGVPPERASAAACTHQEGRIYRIMREVPDGEGGELPPEWTVADLIREAVRKDRQGAHPLEEKYYSCRNIRRVRVKTFPYLRRERAEVYRPYLVFPVSASVMFDESLRQPVPILMCPPGAHDKYGSRVLYSDGSTKKLTAEEAGKLVAEQSPVPLKIEFESEPEEEQKP